MTSIRFDASMAEHLDLQTANELGYWGRPPNQEPVNRHLSQAVRCRLPAQDERDADMIGALSPACRAKPSEEQWRDSGETGLQSYRNGDPY
jgi:hypothetical protein